VDDDVNIHSTDSIVGASSRMGGVTSTAVLSGWVPFPGDLSVVVTKMRKCVESNVGFRYIPMKQYFCESSRGSLPGVLANSYLDTTI